MSEPIKGLLIFAAYLVVGGLCAFAYALRIAWKGAELDVDDRQTVIALVVGWPLVLAIAAVIGSLIGVSWPFRRVIQRVREQRRPEVEAQQEIERLIRDPLPPPYVGED